MMLIVTMLFKAVKRTIVITSFIIFLYLNSPEFSSGSHEPEVLATSATNYDRFLKAGIHLLDLISPHVVVNLPFASTLVGFGGTNPVSYTSTVAVDTAVEGFRNPPIT
jgi:hypothetical protein